MNANQNVEGEKVGEKSAMQSGLDRQTSIPLPKQPCEASPTIIDYDSSVASLRLQPAAQNFAMAGVQTPRNKVRELLVRLLSAHKRYAISSYLLTSSIVS